MLFFYIRHGDPIYDPDMLTPLGHEQANAVAKRLCLYGVDRVFASTSNRARQTAEPTCRLLKKEMTVCDWADEAVAWQEFTVLRADGSRTWGFQHPETTRLFNSPTMRALGNEWYRDPALPETFGTGMKRVDEAVDAFFLSLGYRHDRENKRFEAIAPHDERVALFAHQGFGMSFFSSMLDIPYPMFCTRFDMGHTGMSVIDFSEFGGYVYPKVLQLSNDSHLYREGILTGYQNQIRF
ncbi:MAG: histidine phosphatase family protein [Clostridia bacterium]|nr:histidine phosphatase family protein [Clostridia bacterium]